MNTLNSKIGPEELKKIVNRFYDLVFKDSSISHLFNTDEDLIKKKQYMFLTPFLGGPQIYSSEYGHPRFRMRHLPHKIDHSAKEEWLRCMKQAIQESSMSDETKEELFNCFPSVAQHMVNS